MKKLLPIVLLLALLMSMSVPVFATATPTPCYEYTLHIPADCKIQYDITEPQSIGSVTVTSDNWDNITTDYIEVAVCVKHNKYLSNAKGDSKIYCGIGSYDSNNIFDPRPGDEFYIEYIENGAGLLGEGNLYIEVPNWSNAQLGETYSVTITYTSELVVKH